MIGHTEGHICPPSLIKFMNSWPRKLLQNPRKIFAPFVQAGDTAIDIGCGGGFFTVGLAGLVGEQGRVISVDLQPAMLEIAKTFTTKHGVRQRVTLHQCQTDDLALHGEQADFVVAFYMVHEVPDQDRFLRQVRELLRPGGRFMLVEPAFHVTRAMFERTLAEAAAAGLEPVAPVRLLLSRGMLLEAR